MSKGDVLCQNVPEWIEDNKEMFKPPVCNKLMHRRQLSVMFVGGPNQRKDYHLEEGEELYYMVKGDMVVKTFEWGKPKDIHIKEGELWLQPANIHHSPQRFEGTVGLVIERARIQGMELDGLRYFVEKENQPTTDPLFEAWFYCEDLGKQLVPVIKSYFASEQCRTGEPIPGTVITDDASLPCKVNWDVTYDKPINLKQWIADNSAEITTLGRKSIYREGWQSTVYVYGTGKLPVDPEISKVDVWLWQLTGTSTITVLCGVLDGAKRIVLKENESYLVLTGEDFEYECNTPNSTCLVYFQDPARKKPF